MTEFPREPKLIKDSCINIYIRKLWSRVISILIVGYSAEHVQSVCLEHVRISNKVKRLNSELRIDIKVAVVIDSCQLLDEVYLPTWSKSESVRSRRCWDQRRTEVFTAKDRYRMHHRCERCPGQISGDKPLEFDGGMCQIPLSDKKHSIRILTTPICI